MVTKRGWLSQIHLCWFCDKVVSIVPFLKGFFGSDIRTCKRYFNVWKICTLMSIVNTTVPFCSNKMLHTRLSSFLLFQGKAQVFTQVSQYSSGTWLLQCLCFCLPTRQWLPLFAAESTCPWTAVNFSNRLTFSRGKIKGFYEQHLII